RGRVRDTIRTRVDDVLPAAVASAADGDELRVVASGRRIRDLVRAAADLSLEGCALPDRGRLEIVAPGARLADAIRSRIDDDRVLRPRARGDHLTVGAGDRRQHEDREPAPPPHPRSHDAAVPSQFADYNSVSVHTHPYGRLLTVRRAERGAIAPPPPP